MAERKADYRLGYRGDVEGLRAVAILLVVAAHAGVGLLRGGFIGVDVFYILSGYLITGLLVQERATTGRLGFARFYARRLRRLLPALLLMLAVTCIVAKQLVAPTELPLQLSNAKAAALWLSNFQFAFWNLDYFAPASSSALFLHTWSLGVEEQFYLIWPLLIVLALGIRRHAYSSTDMTRLKWLFVFIFAASFALSLVWTYRLPLFAFYMMPARAWQFALGAGVFLAVGSPSFETGSPVPGWPWVRWAGWIGLAMILFSAWFISPAAPYPGTWSLLPSFGAALVLVAGACHGGSSIRTFLSWRPMQAIGRVSYSWYLWHWPVLLLGATVLDMARWWNPLLLVLLSLAIAALSYHFFETPIRHVRRLVAKPRWAIVGAFGIMFVTVAVLQGWQRLANKGAQSPQLARYVVAENDLSVVYHSDCYNRYESTDALVCSFGDRRAAHTALVLGDSKAVQWVPAYREIFTKSNWQLLVLAKTGCPIVDVPVINAKQRREYTECEAWRKNALRRIAELHPDVVVVSESITYPFTEKQWNLGTQRMLRVLVGRAGRVYLMRPTPELPFDGPSCLEPRGPLYAMLGSRNRCTSAAYTPHFEDVGRWLNEAAGSFQAVQFIDMTNVVCPDGLCRAEFDGSIVFRDSGHMTTNFARTLALPLATKLEIDGVVGSVPSGPPPR